MAYAGLTNKIQVQWPDGALSDRSQWVTYSADLQQRILLDFAGGKLVVEAVVDEDEPRGAQLQTAIEFGRQIIQADAQELESKDLLRLEINQNLQDVAMLKPAPRISSQQTAINQIIPPAYYQQAVAGITPATGANADGDSRPNTADNATQSVSEKPAEYLPLPPQVEVYQENGLSKIRFQIDFVNEFQKILVQNYQDDIQLYAREYGIAVSIILAIIETESSFNPRAVSPVPAFGLMQLVPKTAGVDAYQLVYGEQQVVSPDFLFDEKNNLQLGSAYFYLLMNRYLKNIKDDTARFYCAVVSYNTGVGNLSLTFVGKKNIKQAVSKINTMTSAQVYAYLLEHLAAEETVNYLQKIVKRRDKYTYLDFET